MRLRPYVHYVPVKADLSDLHKQFKWAQANPDEAEQIARQGASVARSSYKQIDHARDLTLDDAAKSALDAVGGSKLKPWGTLEARWWEAWDKAWDKSVRS